MTQAARVVLATVALGLAAAASAQTRPGPPSPAAEQASVAVLVLAGHGVERSTADALTEAAIAAVAVRGTGTIVGKEEFQAQLGQGEGHSLECVGSPPCLGRVGIELGVGEVVAGTVGRRDGVWAFHLHRIDIRSGEMRGRVFREIPGDVAAVAAAIQDAVPALYEEAPETASVTVEADVSEAEVRVDGELVGFARQGPVRATSLEPGQHEVIVAAAGYRTWRRMVQLRPGATLELDVELARLPTDEPEVARELPSTLAVSDAAPRISPLVWIGAGVGAAALGVGTYFGVSSQRRPAQGSTRADALSFMEDRTREARAANGLFGVAAVGLSTTIIGLFLSDFEHGRDSRTTWTVMPSPRGFVVGWERRR